MSSKTFTTLSQADCSSFYKAILENAEDKWATAQLLSQNSKFGSAVPMLIVSIEEYIKALVVFFDGQGFTIRKVKGMEHFFTQHKLRYIIAYIAFAMGVFGNDLVRLLLMVKANPALIGELLQDIQTNEAAFQKKMVKYFQKKTRLLLSELDWFASVDLFRQNGMYSDVRDRFLSPLEISEQDYRQVYRRLKKVKTVCRGIIEGAGDNPGVGEHIEKMKKDFRQKGYYDKIAAALASIKERKVDPFKEIKSKLTQIGR
jgi:AbiV family abortive infection protein